MLTSLLDSDFYLFTMGQWAWRHRPRSVARYRFICRNPEGNALLVKNVARIRKAVTAAGDLGLTPPEVDFLKGTGLAADYVDHLAAYHRLDPLEVSLGVVDGVFHCSVFGRWQTAIHWETPLLALISEICLEGRGDAKTADQNLTDKMNRLAVARRRDDLPAIIEMGTRRRYSAAWQATVTARLAAANMLKGTSNPLLAMTLNLPCMGTMAHQYLQAWQAFAPDIRDFQGLALDAWLDEFGWAAHTIALTDLLGTDAFLADFPWRRAHCYDGVRHDSGDPALWGNKVCAHYRALGMDPRAKTAVWSDGLTVDKALALDDQFRHCFGKCMFGIGTSLTNDCGTTPLDAVLKLVEMDFRPVAKLSDVPGKAVGGTPEAIDRLRILADAKTDRAARLAVAGN